tara:strand:- start:2662 stop:3081 length:420 start_codon:yes stop_codon:yes gene_type:complete
MSVKLICVKEGSKLRIKILSYISSDNKEYHNVYNNTYNCRFPRNLREDGIMYTVPCDNVKLQCTQNGTYYYSVSTNGINKIETVITKYIEPECVICMSCEPDYGTFVPCGHCCICKECNKKMVKKDECPLCRTKIIKII